MIGALTYAGGGKITRRGILQGIGGGIAGALGLGKAGSKKGIEAAAEQLKKIEGGLPGVVPALRDIAVTVKKGDFSAVEWKYIRKWLEWEKKDFIENAEEFLVTQKGVTELEPGHRVQTATIDQILDADPDQALTPIQHETLRELVNDAEYGYNDPTTGPLKATERDVAERLGREFATSKEFTATVRAEAARVVPEPSARVKEIFDDWAEDTPIFEDRMEYGWEEIQTSYDLSPEEAKDLWNMIGGNRKGWQEPGEFAGGGKIRKLTRRDILKGLGAGAAGALGAGKAGTKKGIEEAAEALPAAAPVIKKALDVGVVRKMDFPDEEWKTIYRYLLKRKDEINDELSWKDPDHDKFPQHLADEYEHIETIERAAQDEYLDMPSQEYLDVFVQDRASDVGLDVHDYGDWSDLKDSDVMDYHTLENAGERISGLLDPETAEFLDLPPPVKKALGGRISKFAQKAKTSRLKQGPDLYETAMAAAKEGDVDTALEYLRQLQELLELDDESFKKMIAGAYKSPHEYEFPQKFAEGGPPKPPKKGKTGALLSAIEMFAKRAGKQKVPGMEIPEGFASFYSKRGTSGYEIVGVRPDGSEHRIGRIATLGDDAESKAAAEAITAAYNSGGFGKPGIEHMNLTELFRETEGPREELISRRPKADVVKLPRRPIEGEFEVMPDDVFDETFGSAFGHPELGNRLQSFQDHLENLVRRGDPDEFELAEMATIAEDALKEADYDILMDQLYGAGLTPGFYAKFARDYKKQVPTDPDITVRARISGPAMKQIKEYLDELTPEQRAESIRDLMDQAEAHDMGADMRADLESIGHGPEGGDIPEITAQKDSEGIKRLIADLHRIPPDKLDEIMEGIDQKAQRDLSPENLNRLRSELLDAGLPVPGGGKGDRLEDLLKGLGAEEITDPSLKALIEDPQTQVVDLATLSGRELAELRGRDLIPQDVYDILDGQMIELEGEFSDMVGDMVGEYPDDIHVVPDPEMEGHYTISALFQDSGETRYFTFDPEHGPKEASTEVAENFTDLRKEMLPPEPPKAKQSYAGMEFDDVGQIHENIGNELDDIIAMESDLDIYIDEYDLHADPEEPGAWYAKEVVVKEADSNEVVGEFRNFYIDAKGKITEISSDEMPKFQEGGRVRFQEGGPVEEDRPAMNYLRAMGTSLSNQLAPPGSFREDLARTVGQYGKDWKDYGPFGFKSQWHGINPTTGEVEYAGPWSGAPKPDDWLERHDRPEYKAQLAEWQKEQEQTGAIPGIVDEAMLMPALPMVIEMIIAQSRAEKRGEELPEDYEPFFGAPEFSMEALDRAGATWEALKEKSDLPEPEGWSQNLATAGGIMAGQLPLPYAAIRGLKPLLKRIPGGRIPATPAITKQRKVDRAIREWTEHALPPEKTHPLTSLLGGAGEFLVPSIEPKLANYAAGTLVGGALLKWMTPEEAETVEAIREEFTPEQARLIATYNDPNSTEEEKDTAARRWRHIDEEYKETRLREMLELSDEGVSHIQGQERRDEAMESLFEHPAGMAGGGKIKGITRRDLLKGLGAGAVAAGAAGKAGSKKGIAEAGAELEQLAKALEEAAPVATKVVVPKGAAAQMREIAEALWADADDFTKQVDKPGAWEMEEIQQMRGDAEDFNRVGELFDKGESKLAIEHYDSMDTMAREQFYDLLPDDDITNTRRILAEAGSDWETRPLETHPDLEEIKDRAFKFDQENEIDKLDELLGELETAGYDIDDWQVDILPKRRRRIKKSEKRRRKLAGGGKIGKFTRRDLLKGAGALGAVAGAGLGAGKAGVKKGIQQAAEEVVVPSFTRLAPDSPKTVGTSGSGRIRATLDELIEMFGEPDDYLRDRDKSTVEWDLEMDDGSIVTIYDYKDFDAWMDANFEWNQALDDFDIPEGMTLDDLHVQYLEEMDEWHVGGSKDSLEKLKEVFG